MNYIKLLEEHGDDNLLKWFNGSQIVDGKGDPLVVYHGSQEEFAEFHGDSYFTDDYFIADGYASGEYVYEVYLCIKKPLVIDAKGKKWDDIDTPYGTTTQAVVANVNRSLYDGIIFENVKDSWIDDEDYQDPSSVYVTFNPNQIKSAESNTGNFDGNSPDINENRPAAAALYTFNEFRREG